MKMMNIKFKHLNLNVKTVFLEAMSMAGEIQISVCDCCFGALSRFDFGRRCCRVRFLVALPSKGLRAGWLGQWEERIGVDAVEGDRRVLAALWPRRGEGVALVLADLLGVSDGEG
jgi:hypothetical protein